MREPTKNVLRFDLKLIFLAFVAVATTTTLIQPIFFGVTKPSSHCVKTFPVVFAGENWSTTIRPSVFQKTPTWNSIGPPPISNAEAIQSAEDCMKELTMQGWPEGAVVDSQIRSYDVNQGYYYWLVRFELSDLQNLSIAVLMNGRTVELKNECSKGGKLTRTRRGVSDGLNDCQ